MPTYTKFSHIAAASLVVVCGQTTASGANQPQPAAPAPAIASPKDEPYPGVIELSVDATDLSHGIFAVHEVVPVKGGRPVTLLYPKWIVGNHGPSGPIENLAGLTMTANGRSIEWTRDPVNMYAFHVDVPPHVSSLQVDFQFLSPVSTREGRVVMTPAMLDLEWHTVVLYPAGHFARQIHIAPALKLPAGFTPATALDVGSSAGDAITYRAVTLEHLVDSPVIAGKYFTRIDLDPGGPAHVMLDVIADKPSELAATTEQIAVHRALVQQAYKLFDSRHYAHYDFLVSLSNRMGGIGFEHLESSEDGTIPTYFTDWDKTPAGRDLLAHEYTHSWNGKFRRPANLWVPSFDVPMRDGLLWVYEGQTEYWGYVLAARSGLLSKQQALDAIALLAATYEHRVGRIWRSLEDTTVEPILSNRKPQSWPSWQRSLDYYSEGLLVWLDVDTLIRERSGGKRSLDDVAKVFFGDKKDSGDIDTYTFDDVVGALNSVAPYDWSTFFHQRLTGHGPGAPLDGVTRGGYRLMYDDKQSEYAKSAEARRRGTEVPGADLMFSLGIVLNKEGMVTEVLWDGPAFKAGLAEGTLIVAVNGTAYNSDELKSAIQSATDGTAPIELLVKGTDQFRTVRIDYHEGLRYPHLERIPGTAERLDEILAAKP